MPQPIPPEQRLKFFVYIIESPSETDIYDGRSEGQLLQHSLKLNEIKGIVRTVISKNAFEAAIKLGLPEAMKEFPNLVPIIHISAHGNDDGIGFSNGESLAWWDLKSLLQPVNAALNNSLFVCMSACGGFGGIQMAMSREDEDYPFLALIGCTDSPTWAESSIAFNTLYHLLNKGHTILDSLSAMNAASGLDSFKAERAEKSRTLFREFLSRRELESAQTQLEAQADEIISSEKTDSPLSPPPAKPAPEISDLSKFAPSRLEKNPAGGNTGVPEKD